MIQRAIAIDFEFGPGPSPRCLVARDVGSGELWRVWETELYEMPRAPFSLGPDTVAVAYYGSAEIGCFLALGWPRPAHLVDLYAEFRLWTNGHPPKGGHSLVGALNYFGLPALAVEEKDAMRELAIRGGPWQPGERDALLDYCQTDVDALVALWPKLGSKLGWPALP
jgi:hypothetical protein